MQFIGPNIKKNDISNISIELLLQIKKNWMKMLLLLYLK